MSSYEYSTEHKDIEVVIPSNAYKLVVASYNLNPSVKIIDTEQLKVVRKEELELELSELELELLELEFFKKAKTSPWKNAQKEIVLPRHLNNEPIIARFKHPAS